MHCLKQCFNCDAFISRASFIKATIATGFQGRVAAYGDTKMNEYIFRKAMSSCVFTNDTSFWLAWRTRAKCGGTHWNLDPLNKVRDCTPNLHFQILASNDRLNWATLQYTPSSEQPKGLTYVNLFMMMWLWYWNEINRCMFPSDASSNSYFITSSLTHKGKGEQRVVTV